MRKSDAHTLLNVGLRSDLQALLHRAALALLQGSFLPNWHHDAIAYQLERVRRGEINRLIINLPPRCLKSIFVSVVFPALLLGLDPRKKIFNVSYGSELAEQHASDFKFLVEQDWFRHAFPQLKFTRMANSDFYTSKRGFRRSTSIHATLTGLGGDVFIIDDPLKAADAQSDAIRNAANEWVLSTLSSRLDDKVRGVIIVVMQRVHMFDLTGFLLEKSSDWTVLSLPAIAEVDEMIPIGDGRYHHRRAGEALHPEREPLEVLERLRREVGPDIFAAQWQQCPVPPGGKMIRREWLRYYDVPPKRTRGAKVIQSWDTAAKDGAQNDWSVCTTWLVLDDNYYLLDLTRGRYDYPALRKKAIALAEQFKPDIVLVEDASTGIALAQELKGIVSRPVKPIPASTDKTGRLYVVQDKFEAGRVHFPRAADFLPELETELLTFPQGKTDDQVDSISQALHYKSIRYDTSLSWI